MAILFLVSLIHAVNTVAVLEIVPAEEMELKAMEYRYLTDELRTKAREALPKNSYAILTRDNILQLMPSDSEEALCLAESCVIEVGRAIGAEYVTQGFVGKFDGMLTLTVELYESMSGNLLSSFTTESKNLTGLLNTIREKAPAMFKEIASPSEPLIQDGISSVDIVQGSVLTDARNGKKYKTVKIGNQIWMAENLNYNVSGSKCYDNKSDNCAKYGRLYDWAMARQACPKGWHLPSDAEWKTLENVVGGSSSVGSKLKAKSGWNSASNGTDNYGFSALPGGYGNSNGSFLNVGNRGYWWSSTESSAIRAYFWYMHYFDFSNVLRYYDLKTSLRSVRCLQD